MHAGGREFESPQLHRDSTDRQARDERCRQTGVEPAARSGGDIRNAGGTVLDQEVVIDGNIVSSRRPDDLPAFCRAIVAHFAAVGVST